MASTALKQFIRQEMSLVYHSEKYYMENKNNVCLFTAAIQERHYMINVISAIVQTDF